MISNNNNQIYNFLEPIQRFFKVEAMGGIVLLITTLVALIWANSPWSGIYHSFLENHITIDLGYFSLSKTFLHWINDGLMAIFFFVVGLEIKRELIVGELSTFRKAAFPIAAAIGGMIFPALIYATLNSNPETKAGWGIPMATDIAFSLGILSLLGKRVPISLKVFLLAFAIVDDLGAVLIIALFYSHDLQWSYLLVGISLVLMLAIFNKLRIKAIQIYMLFGWVIWYLFLKSGIHPTIAGVMIAFTIPLKRSINLVTFKNQMQNNLDNFHQYTNDKNRITLTNVQMAVIDNMENHIYNVQSPVQRLEHILHRFVTYVVMPVFALTNAGVVLNGLQIGDIFSGVSGIIQISLILGKVLGIFLFSWLSVKIGFAALPDNIQWKHVLSIGLLGGMGFTMSLFISSLAFSSDALLNNAKIGILAGSLIAGIGGYIMLRLTLNKNTVN
jgi:NhaA family Na+:H+ antiporter